LIRHGAVADPWPASIYGCLDVPLSAHGRMQAHLAAERLRSVDLAAVVSSGLLRAEYGAACIRAYRALGRRDEPDLREIDRGDWAGVSFAELELRDPGAHRRWLAAPHEVRPPNGENLADVAARALPCLQALAEEHSGSAVAVVAHSWVVRVALCTALELPLQRSTALELATGGIAAIDWPVGAARPGDGSDGGVLRPTLVGFALDASPPPSRTWFRGVHRSP
jgi:broad specificity phosphatase PhoE